MQLNSHGFANKKTELIDLISKEKPDVLCIQENMLSKHTNLNLKKYNGLFKEGHTNYRAHEGVPIFIHETIHYQNLILNTPLQAIAARINKGRDVSIVSIYNSLSRDISESLLSALFQNLPKPVMLTGDFKSYHQIWGNPANDNRVSGLKFYHKNQTSQFKRRKTYMNIGHLEIRKWPHNSITFFTAQSILECHKQLFK